MPFNRIIKSIKKTYYRNGSVKDSKPSIIKKWGNYSERIGIGIAFVLACATIALFILNWKATNAAVKSANNTDSAIIEQRFNDSISRLYIAKNYSRDSAKAVFDSSQKVADNFRDSITKHKGDSISKLNFELAAKTLQKQIDFFDTSQKELKAENEPYLVVTHVDVDTPILNKDWLIRFTLNNIGNSPVKITDVKCWRYFGDAPNESKGEVFIGENSTLNTYIIKDNPRPIFITNLYPSQDEINSLKSVFAAFYVKFVIKYRNLTNGELKECVLPMRVNPFNSINTFQFYKQLTNTILIPFDSTYKPD